MRKLHFILKFLVAFILATFAVALCIRYDASDRVVIVVYLGTTILTMLALGAFDVPAKREQSKKYDTIRHKTGCSYGQAAVFIGTAILFVGTPKDCEDMCDSLLHYGQQAHMRMLTGEEKFDVL